MKHLTVLVALFVSLNTWAQVKGNQQITTETYPLSGITSLEMNLYAEVLIDCAAEEVITITADENLLERIERSVEGGHLKLTQKEWIQASQTIKITIGAPNLERIEHSVHETTRVININRADFSATALVGQLVLEGKVDQLSANGEIGTVDAQALDAKNVDVNLWSHGKIKLASPAQINGLVKEDGEIVYKNASQVNVRTKNGGRIYGKSNPAIAQKNPDARFIDFKVKNNSLSRIQCYVKGPKPDGSHFSYGFPMNPGQVRKKNWSVGSKVYKVSKLGTKKLLAEIVATDEGEVVKLHE